MQKFATYHPRKIMKYGGRGDGTEEMQFVGFIKKQKYSKTNRKLYIFLDESSRRNNNSRLEKYFKIQKYILCFYRIKVKHRYSII